MLLRLWDRSPALQGVLGVLAALALAGQAFGALRASWQVLWPAALELHAISQGLSSGLLGLGHIGGVLAILGFLCLSERWQLLGPIEPEAIIVRGAAAPRVNGTYFRAEPYNERPSYRNPNGSVIYFSGGLWKMNDEDSFSGWHYSQKPGLANRPPSGVWTTEGYRGPNMRPLPIVSHQWRSPECSFLVVTGAGGSGARCNGTYRRSPEFHEKCPVFRQVGGDSVLFRRGGLWLINYKNDFGGWYYSQKADLACPNLPPEGKWTTKGYAVGDANPAPTVRRHTGTRPKEEPEVPQMVEVWIEGAEGKGKPLNVCYRPGGTLHGRPVYLNGTKKVYFDGIAMCWKVSLGSETSWLHSHPSTSNRPPQGLWTGKDCEAKDPCPKPKVYLFEPRLIILEWAHESGRKELYLPEGVVNERPLYLRQDGLSVIIWEEGSWKVGPRDGEGCFYCIGCSADYPPAGMWRLGPRGKGEPPIVTSQVYARAPERSVGEASGTAPRGQSLSTLASALQLELSRSPAKLRPRSLEPFASAADCRVGDRVCMLPRNQSEPAVQASSVTWNTSYALMCKEVGTVKHIDLPSGMFWVHFNKGRKLLLPFKACSPVWRILVRDGARLNGDYVQRGWHQDRPKYRFERFAVYYGDDGAWHIGAKSGQGRSCRISSEDPIPPEGRWTSESQPGVDSAPTVARELDRDESCVEEVPPGLAPCAEETVVETAAGPDEIVAAQLGVEERAESSQDEEWLLPVTE
jgi:hypothetical protein